MFDRWMLHDFAPGEGLAAGAHSEGYQGDDWLDIAAPGDVHRALIAAGRIPDPFYDRNEERCRWIEDCEWWYRLVFDGPDTPPRPGERLRLVFHGLDTFATIWLNGEELGRHANMFREAVFDVGDRVRFGEANTLALCFDRPLDHLDGMDVSPQGWGDQDLPRVAMRKAQFGYGWDWGPRLPTVGIWRPVELLREDRAAISGVHAYTLDLDQDAHRALVAVRVEADRFGTTDALTARIRLTPPNGGPAVEAMLALGGDHSSARDSPGSAGVPPVPASDLPHASDHSGLALTAYLPVDDAQLWWTHDLGTPALYKLEVTLELDGAVLARHDSRVGIRTVELDQSPDGDAPGTRFFRFVLNGAPLFARGADWIPADSFVGALTPDRYTMLLTAARDGNMTMLRVWGGGLYEHDIFYDECDRLGLLVWQDFMFACAPYPEDNPAFVAEVEAEARYQVRRLRNHPSLALWCGNNENQWIDNAIHWQQPERLAPGALYYDTILPRAVAAHDGRTPYWPGSPYGGNDYNSMEDGDRHNWDVWHGGLPRRFGEQPRGDHTPEGVSYLHYAEDRGRFISEFGMHAAPVYETLRRVIPPDQLYHHSPSMDWHNKDNPKNKGDNLMLTVMGLPANLDEYIDFSMIAQAEGLKFGIEHFRRRAPHCSGTLVWQLNDCWPVLSWSVLDYYGVGKAGYYYLRRVYAPLLASFKGLEDGSVELWITNDGASPVEDTVTVRLGAFDGADIWTEDHAVAAPPRTSRAVQRWEASELNGAPDRYLGVTSGSGAFPTNRHFFAAIKDLQRTPSAPAMIMTVVDPHEVRVELHATGYAYFVHLLSPDDATRFGDNYFDLAPRESRAITVTNASAPLSPDSIEVRWR